MWGTSPLRSWKSNHPAIKGGGIPIYGIGCPWCWVCAPHSTSWLLIFFIRSATKARTQRTRQRLWWWVPRGSPTWYQYRCRLWRWAVVSQALNSLKQMEERASDADIINAIWIWPEEGPNLNCLRGMWSLESKVLPKKLKREGKGHGDTGPKCYGQGPEENDQINHDVAPVLLLAGDMYETAPLTWNSVAGNTACMHVTCFLLRTCWL